MYGEKNVCNSWGCAKAEARFGNIIQVFHVSVGNQFIEPLLLLLIVSVGSWTQKLQLGIELGYSNVGLTLHNH